jgi:hypothetical protein
MTFSFVSRLHGTAVELSFVELLAELLARGGILFLLLGCRASIQELS